VTAETEIALPRQFGDVHAQEKLGEGGRSIVYGGEWRGRKVALKVYKSAGIRNHAKRHPLNIAEFEFRRNKSFYELPGLSDYIAQPLDYWTNPELSAFVQERLRGPLYYFYYRDHKGVVPASFMQHLQTIIDLTHAAGLFDVDIHAFNVIVDESGSEPIPKLFDFNLMPFHERPGISMSKLMLMLGFGTEATRDKRLLKNFNKIARREKKLLKYFE
jgi:hypothetical protein